MEWLTQIGISASGLPWWAAFVLILLTWASTKGMTAALKWRKATLEEHQYADGMAKDARELLIAELKNRVDKLETIVESQNGELKEVRAAHSRCEIEQAKLQGQLDVMKEKVARLEVHDQKGQQHLEELKKAVEVKPG